MKELELFEAFRKKKNIFTIHLKLKQLFKLQKHNEIRTYAKELGISTSKKSSNLNDQDSYILCEKILNKIDLLTTKYLDYEDLDKICKSEILELSLQRKPNLEKFPNWATIVIKNKCFNIFDLDHLIYKKKIELPNRVQAELKNKINLVLEHFDPSDLLVEKFLKRQTSVKAIQYNYSPILMSLKEYVVVVQVPKIKKSSFKAKKRLSTPKEPKMKFRFPKNYIRDYYTYPVTTIPQPNNDNITDITSVIATRNIKLCKEFVYNLCGGNHGRHVEPNNDFDIKLRKEIKEMHLLDDDVTLNTLGYTSITCDKKSAFDASHNCSKIVIKESPPNIFRKTLVHELLHCEIHERRDHPLLPQTTRSMSDSNKFEEGICVLAEFIACTLGFKSDGVLKRTSATDEYMQKLGCIDYVDNFGTKKVYKSEKRFEYEKKYCAGFGLALESMTRNNLTFLELLESFITHGIFPIPPKN